MPALQHGAVPGFTHQVRAPEESGDAHGREPAPLTSASRQSWEPMPRSQPMQWSSDAEQRLKEVPFFVRPVVRRRIESLAAEAGRSEVDGVFYEEAKARFGEK